MNPVDLDPMMSVSLNLNTLPPEQPKLIDGFGTLIDKALNTNRIFQQAPLMMMDGAHLKDRAFRNSSDMQPDTITGYQNAVDRNNIRISANDGISQNLPSGVSGAYAGGQGYGRVEGGSELQNMELSLQDSMKMMQDMNQRSALNNLMLTYAMANFTVLDTAVKSVSGAIDTLSRAQ